MLADWIQGEDRFQIETLVSQLIDGKVDSFQIDIKPVVWGRHTFRWSAWKIPGASGRSEAILATAELLSSESETDERLRQAQRLETVGRLAGGVAHDFNNLLTGVLLYCDLLLSCLEHGHRARKYAEEIRKAGFQATEVVRQLLAVGKPATSAPRLHSINEIAQGMRNLLTRLIGEQIELKFHLDPNLGLVKMDPAQLQQILLNLVLNARDAMPHGGYITIETGNCKVGIRSGDSDAEQSLECTLLTVSDNGQGMDEQTRARVFEPFYTTKGEKGTGLGLATVREIITNCGGLISINSAVAQGTRVSVLLPLATVENKDSCSRANSYPLYSGELPSSQAKE